ncbi:hypothetical protein [Rhodococcus sp. D-46]|uniref:hypothetical protein n=1 Tax=Rhodococcus sp. D-46 TaxID=2716265 RepID=UPI0013F59AD7
MGHHSGQKRRQREKARQASGRRSGVVRQGQDDLLGWAYSPRVSERDDRRKTVEAQQKGETWELMYAIDSVRQLIIEVPQSNAVVGYKPNNSIQGFTVLDQDKSDNLVELLTSLEFKMDPELVIVDTRGMRQTRSGSDSSGDGAIGVGDARRHPPLLRSPDQLSGRRRRQVLAGVAIGSSEAAKGSAYALLELPEH